MSAKEQGQYGLASDVALVVLLGWALEKIGEALASSADSLDLR